MLPRLRELDLDGACAAAVDEEFGAGKVPGAVGDKECYEIADIAGGSGLS